jgi:tartrate dehydratase beta subunit/fumarate hydratase class I family protein
MIKIHTPFNDEILCKLKPFDKVLITGYMYIARDQAHKRMYMEGIPFDAAGQCIYHCGPSEAKNNEVIGSAGPTSSYRMNEYMPYMFETKSLYNPGAIFFNIIAASISIVPVPQKGSISILFLFQ